MSHCAVKKNEIEKSFYYFYFLILFLDVNDILFSSGFHEFSLPFSYCIFSPLSVKKKIN